MGIVIFSRVSFAVLQMYNTSIVSVSNYCLGARFCVPVQVVVEPNSVLGLCGSIRCSGQSGNCFFCLPKK